MPILYDSAWPLLVAFEPSEESNISIPFSRAINMSSEKQNKYVINKSNKLIEECCNPLANDP